MSLQETIIQQLGVKPVIDAQEEIRRSIDFLKRYLKKHPFLKTFVLGISGGQDLYRHYMVNQSLYQFQHHPLD